MELCSDLSTSAMLAALSHFVSHRGLPSKIVSDNGTNFVGAARELADCNKLLHSKDFQNKATELSTVKPIDWRPMGGQSEGNEGNTTQDTPTTSPEEKSNMIADVEAFLNSHPLLPLDRHHGMLHTSKA